MDVQPDLQQEIAVIVLGGIALGLIPALVVARLSGVGAALVYLAGIIGGYLVWGGWGASLAAVGLLVLIFRFQQREETPDGLARDKRRARNAAADARMDQLFERQWSGGGRPPDGDGESPGGP